MHYEFGEPRKTSTNGSFACDVHISSKSFTGFLIMTLVRNNDQSCLIRLRNKEEGILVECSIDYWVSTDDAYDWASTVIFKMFD